MCSGFGKTFGEHKSPDLNPSCKHESSATKLAINKKPGARARPPGITIIPQTSQYEGVTVYISSATCTQSIGWEPGWGRPSPPCRRFTPLLKILSALLSS